MHTMEEDFKLIEHWLFSSFLLSGSTRKFSTIIIYSIPVVIDFWFQGLDEWHRAGLQVGSFARVAHRFWPRIPESGTAHPD